MRTQLLTLDHLVQLIDPALYLHLQSADSTNFFFFFRMLLVWYKREFEWPDVLRLWESLWTDFLSSNFHLFIALAILEKHRDVIMEHLKHFDEVLKYGTFYPSLSCLPFACCFRRDPGSKSIGASSQRTLQHNRPSLHSPSRPVSLPPLPTHRRSYRQKEQFPSSQHSSAQTRRADTFEQRFEADPCFSRQEARWCWDRF